MSKYLENKKVNAYRKRLQSEGRRNEESKNAPMTAAKRIRRMRQSQQFEASSDRLKQFVNDKFRLLLATDPTDFTTLKNTTIDLMFSRHMSVACKSYISYYSYHCPVFNKILHISPHCQK
jgi:predicted MPP superfamily phosphohydrolase